MLVLTACHCGKNTRRVTCNEDTSGVTAYACDASSCGRALDCGLHHCPRPCHPGECAPCPLTPAQVTRCPCGQTELEKLVERDGVPEKRKSCLDPVPTCGLVCGKRLGCGHTCQALCHQEEECPPCPLTTEVRCRCGFMDKEVDCKDLKTRKDDARCDKR